MKKISNIENIRNLYVNSDSSSATSQLYREFKDKIFHDRLSHCPEKKSDDKPSKYGSDDPISKGKVADKDGDQRVCAHDKFDLAVWGASYVELAYKYCTGRKITIFPCVDAFCTCVDDSRSDATKASEEVFKHKLDSAENAHNTVEHALTNPNEGPHSGETSEEKYQKAETAIFEELPVYLPPIRSMLHEELDYKSHKERYTETAAHRLLLPYVSMVRKAVQKPIVGGKNVLEDFMARRGAAAPGQWLAVQMRDLTLKAKSVGYPEPKNVVAATLGGGAGYFLASYYAKLPSNPLFRKILYTSGGGALAAVTLYQLHNRTIFQNFKLKRDSRK